VLVTLKICRFPSTPYSVSTHYVVFRVLTPLYPPSHPVNTFALRRIYCVGGGFFLLITNYPPSRSPFCLSLLPTTNYSHSPSPFRSFVFARFGVYSCLHPAFQSGAKRGNLYQSACSDLYDLFVLYVLFLSFPLPAPSGLKRIKTFFHCFTFS